MTTKTSNILLPKNIQELQHFLGEYPFATILAGGTSYLLRQINRTFTLPQDVISIQNIPELLQISKTERYIDVGASATLNKLISLGRKNIPAVLYEALCSIGNIATRNLATIGGNIASKDCMTLLAPLIALDAKVELRSSTESVLVPITKFLQQRSSLSQETLNTLFSKKNVPYSAFCITKIRIPLEDWDISSFNRLQAYNSNSLHPDSFALTIALGKNNISDIRIAYSGNGYFRQKELENRLTNHIIPLSKNDIEEMIKIAREYISNLPEKQIIIRNEITNIIKTTLMHLR